MRYKITFPNDSSDARRAANVMVNSPEFTMTPGNRAVCLVVMSSGSQGKDSIEVDCASEALGGVRSLITKRGG
jgi:hypothetical protein